MYQSSYTFEQCAFIQRSDTCIDFLTMSALDNNHFPTYFGEEPGLQLPKIPR